MHAPSTARIRTHVSNKTKEKKRKKSYIVKNYIIEKVNVFFNINQIRRFEDTTEKMRPNAAIYFDKVMYRYVTRGCWKTMWTCHIYTEETLWLSNGQICETYVECCFETAETPNLQQRSNLYRGVLMRGCKRNLPRTCLPELANSVKPALGHRNRVTVGQFSKVFWFPFFPAGRFRKCSPVGKIKSLLPKNIPVRPWIHKTLTKNQRQSPYNASLASIDRNVIFWKNEFSSAKIEIHLLFHNLLKMFLHFPQKFTHFFVLIKQN